ncbi:hypothetical protein ACLOJK_039548 [Asimina triloba]
MRARRPPSMSGGCGVAWRERLLFVEKNPDVGSDALVGPINLLRSASTVSMLPPLHTCVARRRNLPFKCPRTGSVQ